MSPTKAIIAPESVQNSGITLECFNTLCKLAAQMNKRDPYTHDHQLDVCKHAAAIAQTLGLSSEQIVAIWCGALIHDLGKLDIPLTLLNKQGKLTEQEFTIVKQHAKYGFKRAKIMQLPPVICDIVGQHHERLIGSGYPSGLTAEAISLPVRIVCVADVYLAIAIRRPYRGALGSDFAFSVLEDGAGTLFDKAVIQALKDSLAKQNLFEQFTLGYIRSLINQ